MNRKGKRPPPGDMQRLAQLLSQAERRVTGQLRQLLERTDCTVERWRALVLLADGAPHSMSELGEFALLPPPSLTRLVDGLVAENLAYRQVDPTDRRRVLVHISRRGRALHDRLAKQIEEERDAILAEASGDHVAELAALLSTLVERPR